MQRARTPFLTIIIVGFSAPCWLGTMFDIRSNEFPTASQPGTWSNMKHFLKSLTVVTFATGAWMTVPLGMFFQHKEATSSQFPVYLLAGSVLLAVTSMYIGHSLRPHNVRLVNIGYDLAKVYLQVTGLLVVISIVLSYTGKWLSDNYSLPRILQNVLKRKAPAILLVRYIKNCVI